MTEFKSFSQAGLTEALGQLGEAITIAGVASVTSGTWQETEEGKELESDAGFNAEMGGNLIISLSQLNGTDPKTLSGKVVTRTETGEKKRITGVRVTKLIADLTLSPTSR